MNQCKIVDHPATRRRVAEGFSDPRFYLEALRDAANRIENGDDLGEVLEDIFIESDQQDEDGGFADAISDLLGTILRRLIAKRVISRAGTETIAKYDPAASEVAHT